MTSAMRLLRLRLDGGPMRGEWSFAPEGATLITAPAAARHAIPPIATVRGAPRRSATQPAHKAPNGAMPMNIIE